MSRCRYSGFTVKRESFFLFMSTGFLYNSSTCSPSVTSLLSKKAQHLVLILFLSFLKCLNSRIRADPGMTDSSVFCSVTVSPAKQKYLPSFPELMFESTATPDILSVLTQYALMMGSTRCRFGSLNPILSSTTLTSRPFFAGSSSPPFPRLCETVTVVACEASLASSDTVSSASTSQSSDLLGFEACCCALARLRILMMPLPSSRPSSSLAF
mmetsp:Transcript_4616/g.11620  ORF Transcript_4616/g.11620 Transcript_4616/m.11620 type:complete len:212 (+) Transcript_4616:178-813(+)